MMGRAQAKKKVISCVGVTQNRSLLAQMFLFFNPHQKLYHHENPTYCDVGIMFRTCRFTLQLPKRPMEDKVPSSLISNRTLYYSADWPG
jgi:hypothetical protein